MRGELNVATMTLTEPVRRTLVELGEQAELKGTDGETFGYFVSPEAYQRMSYALAKSLVSEEELQTARNQPGGLTTDELRTRLGLKPRN